MPWSEPEIRSYLTGILGHDPAPDRSGNVAIQGPPGFCRQHGHGGHQALMDIRTGRWKCPNCSCGEIEDYEARRSGISSTCLYPERRASEAIREIIRAAEEQASERVRQAEDLIAQLALPPPAARLLRKVYRSAARSRRYLQQVMHLRRGKFQTAIRELERKGLISHRECASTAGRTRKLYFPAALGKPSDTPPSPEQLAP